MLSIVDEPKIFEEAINSKERDEWKNEMDEEYDSLMRSETWKLVDNKSNTTLMVVLKDTI